MVRAPPGTACSWGDMREDGGWVTVEENGRERAGDVGGLPETSGRREKRKLNKLEWEVGVCIYLRLGLLSPVPSLSLVPLSPFPLSHSPA